VKVCGNNVDFGKIKIPAYIQASKEDHIVPWKTAYLSSRLLGGPVKFMLGASGHIAGVINPASKINAVIGRLATATRWRQSSGLSRLLSSQAVGG